ncbi:MAG: BMP family protein [Pseudomonadota bacterium]
MAYRAVRNTFLTTMAAAGALTIAAGPAQGQVEIIAVMTPEQGTDFGWNQQGVDAARAAGEAMGVQVITAEGLGYGDVRPTLRELAGEGADLIIAHASGYNTAAPEVAHETGVAVAIVDTPEAVEPGLIADYTLSGHDGAYLAGILAANMSRSDTVGIVVSGEPPSWNSQSAGFALGARAANPDIDIIYAVIGPAAYADAAGGRRVTESVIAAGADIIFGQGNGSTFGMLQAIETTPAADGDQAWFIDVIGDKSSIDTGFLLSSVVWNLEPVYTAMIDDLNSGDFGAVDYEIGLVDDSVMLLQTEYIPPATWTELMEVRQAIIDGAVEVPAIFDAQEVRALMTTVDASE